MKIKFLCAAAALTAAFSSTSAFADDVTLSGTAAVVSSYKFRGIDQSDTKPVVQMSMTASHKSGFYVSTWGSSLNTANGTEIDVYGGYTHTLADLGLTFDGGIYGYIYPGTTTANTFELYGSVAKAYGPATLKVGLNWAPKQGVFTTGAAAGSLTKYSMYKYAELSGTVPGTPVTLHGHLGHTAGGLSFGNIRPYLDYSVGASYKYKALTFDLSGVGTDVSTATAGSIAARRPAKSILVLSLTAGF